MGGYQLIRVDAYTEVDPADVREVPVFGNCTDIRSGCFCFLEFGGRGI